MFKFKHKPMKFYLPFLFAGASIVCANGANPDTESFETYRDRYTLFHQITFNHLKDEFTRKIESQEEITSQGQFGKTKYEKEMNEFLLGIKLIREQVPNEADYFARIDKRTLPTEERKAFALLENEKPTDALLVYKQIAHLQLPDTATIHYRIPDSLIACFERYAHLNALTGGKENNDNALRIYEAIAWSDTLNPQRMRPYAEWLNKCNLKKEARIWENRIVRSSSDPRVAAEGWFHLGEIASSLKERDQVNYCFENALRQYDGYALQADTSALYRSYQETCFAIGGYYYNRKDYKQATPYFEKLIDKSAMLTDNKAYPLYKPCLRTYMMLAYCYYGQKNFELANRTIEKGIRIINADKPRLEEEADYYLSVFYQLQMYTNMWLNSEKVAQKKMDMAVQTAAELSQRTNSYYSHLADILVSKCILYKKDTKLCTALYEQAVDLMLQEGVYTPYTLIKLNNYRKELADLYWGNGEKKKAIVLLGEMTNTYDLFSNAFAQQLAPFYAGCLQTYSQRLMDMGEYHKVIAINRKGLNIFQNLKSDPSNNINLLSCALLISKSMAKENQLDSAKVMLKQYESYIESIPAQKDRQQWSNAYEKAYKELN